MMVRIAVNVSMTILPFYLTTVVKFEKNEDQPTPIEIATVPLV
jgi:hypothetical protein